MILEIRHLRAIDAIVRAGTVTGAARNINLTQSAVSHIIRDLESKLGVQLFRRDRGMEATPEGERLLTSARVVLDEIERAEHDITQLKDGHQGVLRIATECYTCYHWLPAILEEFSETFPGIDLQIVPEATNEPIEAILSGAVDVAIVHQKKEHEDLVIADLFSDEIVAVMAPDHPLAYRDPVEPEDFADQTLILHARPERSIVLVDVLRPAGVEPQRILQLQLTEAVLEAVKSGLGVTAMARWAVAPDVAAGRLVEASITAEGVCRRWYTAVPRHRADWPPLAALVGLLEREALSAAELCATTV